MVGEMLRSEGNWCVVNFVLRRIQTKLGKVERVIPYGGKSGRPGRLGSSLLYEVRLCSASLGEIGGSFSGLEFQKLLQADAIVFL